jgi:hypothetical protein
MARLMVLVVGCFVSRVAIRVGASSRAKGCVRRVSGGERSALEVEEWVMKREDERPVPEVTRPR